MPSLPADPRSIAQAFLAGAVLLSFAAVVASFQTAGFYTLNVLLAVCVGLTLLYASLLTAWDKAKAIWAGFILLYCLFHFGALPLYLIKPWTTPRSVLEWYVDEPLIRYAYVAALTFLIGMLAATPLFDRIKTSPRQIGEKWRAEAEIVCLLCLAVLVVAWFVIVKELMTANSYLEYIERAAPYARYLPVIYAGIGGSMIFGAIWSRRAWPLFVMFALWAFPALLVGLRYGVLIVLFVSLLALHVRGKIRIGWRLGLGGLIATIAVISFVQLYRLRTVGVGQAFSGISATGALAEMGHSIYPMHAVLLWLQAGIEHLRWGETYWAPLERSLALILPIERPVGSNDMRLMDVAMTHRAGSFGFSISAEAMINFGVAGCLVIGAIAGAALCYAGKAIEAGGRGLVAVALAVGIFYHVRQAFVGAYGSFVYALITGLLLLAIVRLAHFALHLWTWRKAGGALRSP